jgi:hypothetical protein
LSLQPVYKFDIMVFVTLVDIAINYSSDDTHKVFCFYVKPFVGIIIILSIVFFLT